MFLEPSQVLVAKCSWLSNFGGKHVYCQVCGICTLENLERLHGGRSFFLRNPSSVQSTLASLSVCSRREFRGGVLCLVNWHGCMKLI